MLINRKSIYKFQKNSNNKRKSLEFLKIKYFNEPVVASKW